MNYLLIFLGSGIGGIFRYFIAHFVNAYTMRQFPYGTMVVNVSGCLLMGFIFVLCMNRLDHTAQAVRALLLIGVLGGYTTFSTFSMETVGLFEMGEWVSGLMNIMLSVLLCIVATFMGVWIAKQLL